MSYHGTITAQQTRNEASYVHGQGWTTTHEWRGGAANVQGIAENYFLNGWEVRTTKDDPYLVMTATRGGAQDTAQTDYYDKFSITKETLQKQIWTLPEVAVEQEDFDAYYAGLGRTLYVKWIEAAVESGDEKEFDAVMKETDWPVAWKVYRELCRGADSYETEYIVLTRERVVSVEYYRTDVMPIPPLNAARIFISTANLQSEFSIPDLPGVTWPDAVAPTNSAPDLQWGWRERRREIRFQEGARVEIVQDFAWAEWSTNLYAAT